MPSSPASSKTRAMPASFASPYARAASDAEAAGELAVGEPVQRAQLRGVVAARARRHAPRLEHRHARALALEQQRRGESHDARRRARPRPRSRRARAARAPGASRPGTRVSPSPRHRPTRFAPRAHRGMKCPAWDPELPHSACLLALALAGCGTADREHDAAAVAQRFHAALEAGTARPRATSSSEETASKLEQQEKKPCEEAILSLELPKGGTRGRHARVRDERVRHAGRGRRATSSTRARTAGGCPRPAASPPRPSQPYDCELEN